MALFRNNTALGSVPEPAVLDASGVVFRFSFTLPSDVALNDIIELGSLPADAVPYDLIFDTDDLDSGTTGLVAIGLLNAGKTDLDLTASGGAAWLTGASIQAASAFRADAGGLRAMSRMVAAATPRPFGIKVTAETIAAANAKLGVTLMYRQG